MIRLFALTLSLLTSLAIADEASVRKLLEKRLSGVTIVSVNKTEHLGLYEVFTGESLMYTDDSASVLLNGDLIDLKNMRNVSRARLNVLNGIKFSDLPLEQAFKQVHGNGKRVMATFEDPNCGYCKKLAKELAKIDNVTIYTFLVPMLGDDSWRKSAQIWCAADQSKTWNDWMVDNKPPSGTGGCDVSVLKRNVAFTNKYRINGTPAIVFGSGERVPGFIPRDQVEARLGN
jgi:thiol:disulfide interchange protein DsbC